MQKKEIKIFSSTLLHNYSNYQKPPRTTEANIDKTKEPTKATKKYNVIPIVKCLAVL